MSASPKLIAAVRVALGEMYPAHVVNEVRRSRFDNAVAVPGVVSKEHRSRAVRLATMAVSGSDAPATCDTHSLTNRPDVWAQCVKVPVRDALMGRTCGVA